MNFIERSNNKVSTLSFALRLRPWRYHVRDEFLAFNGYVVVHERLPEPFRHSETAFARLVL
jgi:hypothetical protein